MTVGQTAAPLVVQTIRPWIDGASGELAVTLTLLQEGERVRGSIQGALGTVDIANASVSPAGEIRFTAPVTFEGQTTEATFTGTITGNEMKGAVNITGRAPGTFTGRRSPAAAPPVPAATPPPGNGVSGGR